MARVLLQAGHSAEYTPRLTGGGGAPAEAGWTALCCRALAERLADAGVSTSLFGGWLVNGVTYAAPVVARERHDLAIMCHYDANIYGVGGGFIDRYRPEKYKRKLAPTTPEAERFMGLWEARYFPATGILNKSQRRNANTDDYYAYRDMHQETPRVLIEFGVGALGAPDYETLWNRLDVVAGATADAVLAYLGLAPVPAPILPAEEEYGMPALSREDARTKLEQFGYVLPEGFGISERAIESARVNGGREWRGPAISDEYPWGVAGKVRRDFTGGVLEYDPATGEVNWVEVVKEARGG